MEMQTNEVSGGNADSPEAGSTPSQAGSLVQSTPAQGSNVDPSRQKQRSAAAS